MTTASKPAIASARPAYELVSPDNFLASIGPLFGKMMTEEVEGIQTKLSAFAAAASPLAYIAYRLATSFRETGQKMQPVLEIGRGRNCPYGTSGKVGRHNAYRRGDIQLTWDYN